MLQYKVSLIDSIWSPNWKANANGSPKLPSRVPSHVPHHPIWGHDAMRSVEREKFINAGLSKYVEFWKQGMEQSATYAMKMNLYVDY
jgi:hypothetical protein